MAESLMFRFRCAVCGSTPQTITLRAYLEGWSSVERRHVYDLLVCAAGALQEVSCGRARWLTKKFRKPAEKVISAIFALGDAGSDRTSHLTQRSRESLRYDRACPMCYLPAGMRRVDNYFTEWAEACKVQVGNLLYETALVLWHVLATVPQWASADDLRNLDRIRTGLLTAGRAMSLLECPQCGRFTTSLYGDPHGAKQEQFCRWCLDAGGGGAIRLSVSFDHEGQPRVNVTKSDPLAAARNDSDILPPDAGANTRGE